MPVNVRLPTQLRDLSGGAAMVVVDLGGDGATVGDVLEAVGIEHPGVVDRVIDERGRLRRHVSVFLGLDNVRDLDVLATKVPSDGEISIVPAVSGGALVRETAAHGPRRSP